MTCLERWQGPEGWTVIWVPHDPSGLSSVCHSPWLIWHINRTHSCPEVDKQGEAHTFYFHPTRDTPVLFISLHQSFQLTQPSPSGRSWKAWIQLPRTPRNTRESWHRRRTPRKTLRTGPQGFCGSLDVGLGIGRGRGPSVSRCKGRSSQHPETPGVRHSPGLAQHVWVLWPLPEVCVSFYTNSDIQEIMRGGPSSRGWWVSLPVVRLGVCD